MSDTRSIGSAPARPVLVYDGDCRFCRMWIERWRDATGDAVEYLAQQSPECSARFPGLDPVALQEAVHRVDTGGRVTRGAEAVLETLAEAPGWGRLARIGLESPVFLGIAERLYRWVARNRVVFSMATRMLWGASVRRPTWWVSREVFLVGLAAVHLVALLSLWVQVDGLMGEKGVLPAAEFMARVSEQVNEQGMGWDRYRLLPTVGWWGAGDRALHGLCGLGVLLAVLAATGYARALALFGLWLTYLSLSILGQEFFAFQWDSLLLETTFLAVFLAPWRLGRMAARNEAPSRWARGLLVWLLFRLMLESGIVKLASGDPAWRSMTALNFHYWTQPLPGPGSWYVHQLPAWLHRSCCVAMFVIELGLPWLVLAPRRWRGVAFLGFTVLQFAILATGNYTFFNLLALLLGLLLVDDTTWARWRWRGSSEMPITVEGRIASTGGETWRHRLLVGVAVVSLVIGARPLVGYVAPGWNGWSSGLDRWFAPFRTFNDYGLFAVMTTSRSEIVVEGSTDGLLWKAYEFRHKPGAMDRRPGQVAPHQPRLDWQMWFAALGDVRQNPWLVRLGIRLLEGSADVVELLRDNPFPGSPPKYVRARLYAYRFSRPEERRTTGHWWVREEKGLYCPPFSLTDVGGRLGKVGEERLGAFRRWAKAARIGTPMFLFSFTRWAWVRSWASWGAAVLVLGGCGLEGLRTEAVEARPPNVVLILSDDMGYSDIGCYGGEIATPNLDRLAAGGLRFTQFYNTARCCPTRASLLTGLHPHQAGVGHMMEDRNLEGYRGRLNRQCVTIAEALRPAGYRNYAVGKWHVTPGGSLKALEDREHWPLQRGFDRYYGTIHGAGSFWDPSALVRDNTSITVANDPEYPASGYYYTDGIADHAVRFIREHGKDNGERPFFLYVAFTAAHWPMHARERDIAKYKGRYAAGYEAIRAARWAKQQKLGLVESTWERTPTVGDWAKVKDHAFEERCMEVYAAMVDSMDQGIGRMTEALKQSGQWENTLILYLQDNGGCAEGNGRGTNFTARGAGPSLAPMNRDEPQQGSQPKQTREGWPVRQGYGVMPGEPDTYVAYGREWANVSNTPFREYKHWTHEGGIATPLIAHWPAGISQQRHGRLEATPGQLVDILATCVDLARAEYPTEREGRSIPPMEGVSLRPAFEGKPVSRSQPLVWEHEGNRAIRTGDWKLVTKGPSGPWELYDLKRDRTETRDLAADEPERVKTMAAAWEAWARRAKVLPWPWKDGGKR